MAPRRRSGRNSKPIGRWVPGTCNTICDVTGLKVKLSETVTRWDGYQVIPEENEARQPQDFQVTPRAPHVYPKARFPADQAYVPFNPLDL